MNDSSSENIWNLLLTHVQAEFPVDQYKVMFSPFDRRSGVYMYIRSAKIEKNATTLVANSLFECDGLAFTISSGSLFVNDACRGLGYAQRLMRAKIAWAAEINYRIIATVNDWNDVQIHILSKFGWHRCNDKIRGDNSVWIYTPTKE